MNKLLTLITFFLILTRATAQVDCPSGYVKRNIKCNGQIASKCIPENQAGNWYIKWADCNESFETSQYADVFKSYESCLQEAEKAKSQEWFSCPKMQRNVNKYVIFLDDSKYCSTALNGNADLKNDLLNKIKPFLQRYKDEIANYRRYFNGQPYKPGAVFKEYETQLKQAEENVRNLESMLNNVNNNNLQQLENAFNDIQREEQNLKQVDATYKTQINTVKHEEINRQQAEEAKRQKQQLEQQTKSQEKIDAQMRELTRKSQVQANVASGIVDGLGSILGNHQANQAKKSIAEDNNRRAGHFEELKRQVQNEEGELKECTSCYGEGYKDCRSCSATGKKTCGVCYGKAGETCSLCSGIGTYQVGAAKFSCTSCFGKGVKTCSYCGNTGQTLCTTCNGSGKRQCSHCYGTGQEFKREFSEKYQHNYNYTPKADYTYPPRIDHTYTPATPVIKTDFSSTNIPNDLRDGMTEVLNSGNEIRSLVLGSNNSYCLIFGINGYKTNGLKPEMIAELKRCNEQNLRINVATTYGSDGWIVVNEDNGYSYNSIPEGAANEIKRCNAEKLKIKLVVFTLYEGGFRVPMIPWAPGRIQENTEIHEPPSGGWVVINENGCNYSNIPEELAIKIKECNEKKQTISQIAFTPFGGWIIIIDRNDYYYNNIPVEAANEVKAYNSSGKKINFISFCQNGYIIY